ncbi:hypothetical protein SAMN02927923_00180 [Microvirga guangxiensis]|uniref:Uncharacterized protein n=1 Tax=Microvirga guangxiensis TaxID=549386 RepID=A0A1G5BAS8_9HYPH|nr:hypothetical protein SAMN02927923_00180 [Microvirga guangxiensis]
MRFLLILAGMIGCSLVPAEAQTRVPRNECPPNTRPSGAFCLVNIPDSVRNRGACPADYVSTSDGTYCVLAPRKDWVRARIGCPAGYQPSPGGEFCIAN